MKIKNRGFTIVELLVVIVVIGILAAIIIISYVGVSQRAIASSLQSDLTNSSNKLKMYQVEHGSYPQMMTSTDGNVTYCPTPVDINYCIKPSSGNTLVYSTSGSTPQTFTLDANKNNIITYRITESTSPIIPSPWTTGIAATPMAGKYVYFRDIYPTDLYTNGNAIGTSEIKWKTTNTACASPQCTVVFGREPSYPSNLTLVSSNAVDFVMSTSPPTYPARDACKVIGGRLPTMQELFAIDADKISYGNNFQEYYYWSTTNYDNTQAFTKFIDNVSWFAMTKDNDFYVRCVKD